MKRRPLAERFWEKVEKTESCWLWKGARKSSGHGNIAESRTTGEPLRMLSVHRVSWQLHHGPIPDGLVIHHLCRTPNCVRPEHLALMASAAHDELHAAEKRVDECVHGHRYTPANTRIRSDGAKVCRECDRLRQQRNRSGRVVVLAESVS